MLSYHLWGTYSRPSTTLSLSFSYLQHPCEAIKKLQLIAFFSALLKWGLIQSGWPETHNVAKKDLELLFLLQPPHKCWDYRSVQPPSFPSLLWCWELSPSLWHIRRPLIRRGTPTAQSVFWAIIQEFILDRAVLNTKDKVSVAISRNILSLPHPRLYEKFTFPTGRVL